ncbi:serotonin N-acetyltransferase-like [Ptychodera flava]|uniref:serotonin N-acetyltransferase-like n=1 Tax=Ptychodera flava TaxID=63121 RepID=UPI003969F020
MYRMTDINVSIKHLSAEDVGEAYNIEKAGYPADEAAALEMLNLRQREAPELFLGRYHNGRLIGYACGTRSNSKTYTSECLRLNVVGGSTACIHSVCFRVEERGKGYGLDLMKRYIANIKNSLHDIDKITLVCKEDVIPFYKKAGFSLDGPSCVTLGQDKWFECHLDIQRSPTK